MQDINNPLLTAYYTRLEPLYPTYTDEEPDDVNHKLYVVLSDISNNDASTQSNCGYQTTIQVSINSWEHKYNSSMAVNTAAGAILQEIYPTPVSTLTFGAGQIVTTKLQSDVTTKLGETNGRKYITRTLIFSHYIYQN